MFLRFILALTLLLAAALLAGCSGAAPATTGPTATAATPAPATQPPDGASPPPTATFHGAADLESTIPRDVAGMTIEVQSFTAEQFFQAFETDQEDIDQFNAFVAGLGRSPTDVTVAFGFGSDEETFDLVSVIAIRVAGADPGRLLQGLVEFDREEGDTAQVTTETLGGKSVTRLAEPGDEPGTGTYFYSRGDVVYQVEASSLPILEETLSKLP